MPAVAQAAAEDGLEKIRLSITRLKLELALKVATFRMRCLKR